MVIVRTEYRPMQRIAIQLMFCTWMLSNAYGQTLQSGDLSIVPGDAFQFGSIPWTPPSAPGSGQNWDLAGVSTSFTTPYVWLEPSSIVLDSYPSCTVVRQTYFSCSEYWEATSEHFSELSNGCGIDLTAQQFDDPRDIIRYPFSFGDSFIDNYSGEARLQGSTDTIAFNGLITVTADASGEITLPWTSFMNVLRLRVSTSTNYPAIDRTDNELRTWYVVPGLHMPVASYIERWNNLAPDTMRSARILTGTNTATPERPSPDGLVVRHDGKQLVITDATGAPLRACDVLVNDGRLLGSWTFTGKQDQRSLPLEVNTPTLLLIRATDTQGRLHTARMMATP